MFDKVIEFRSGDAIGVATQVVRGVPKGASNLRTNVVPGTTGFGKATKKLLHIQL